MKSRLPVLDEAEVVVVGAGPAGAAAAATLAQLGREVILIDQSKFPRDKPCGDALWSSAVRHLDDMGLGGLIAKSTPVEGTRVVRDGGAARVQRYSADSGRRPLPRCIPRLRMDAALFAHAIASGARFVQGRVEDTVESDERVVAVSVRRRDDSRFKVSARQFIAADGVTSRMRRVAGLPSPATALRAYAVRQYFRTEKANDGLFEVHLPLRFEDWLLPGYGWVFPVAEDIVNIGIGFQKDPKAGASAARSLRKLLDTFVERLRSGAAHRLGNIEAITDANGAPVAINFSAQGVQKANILFVGDAARMTDPLIGEGIAAALRSGEMAAQEVERLLQRRPRSDLGSLLLREFPRLAQDTAILARAHDRLFDDAGEGENAETESKQRGRPFAQDVARVLMRGADENRTIEETEVFRLMAERDGGAANAFHEFNRLALDTLRTEFPFALELLFRELHASAGASYAATLLLAQAASGRKPDDSSAAAALAGELLRLATHFLGRVGNNIRERGASLGNGLATLIADHALSHGLRAATSLGPHETVGLARLARTVYEGAMLEADDAWNLNRSPERYLSAVSDHAGSLHAYAAGLGARLAGKNGATADLLTHFGYNLGIALAISGDVVELVAGDYPTARAPGESIRHGSYTLPVIYALEDDPALGGLLGPAEIEDALADVVKRIRATNAIKRCVTDCMHYVEQAKAALEQSRLDDPHGLADLSDLAVSRCNEHTGEPTAQAAR